jgi:hypothetical protein
MAREVSDVTAHPSGDGAADPQAHVPGICVVYFGEYCEALRIAIDTHGDHTAFSHTVHSFGGSLDIVWVQVPASEHDEILGAAADVESPMLVEISQVPGVEPTVIARE